MPPDFRGFDKIQRRQRIHHEYECIQYDLRDATLFGGRVDVCDKEQLVVAAFHAGREEALGLWGYGRKRGKPEGS